MNTKKILLIEDDPFHIAVIKERIGSRWPGTHFDDIRTEKQFMRNCDWVANAGYDLVIIDQMIPYTSIEDESDDREALQLSAFRGGTRCYERLRSIKSSKNTPVIFYTILDGDSVPPDAEYVRKSDSEMSELLLRVGQALTRRSHARLGRKRE
jgi:CheY-like chemotaxis protein